MLSAGVVLFVLALLMGWIVPLPGNARRVTLEFMGVVTNMGTFQIAEFRISNHSASPIRIQGAYVERTDPAGVERTPAAFDINLLPPHQDSTFRLHLLPRSGRRVLAVTHCSLENHPLRTALAEWLWSAAWSLPDDLGLKPRIQESITRFGGTYLATSDPFEEPAPTRDTVPSGTPDP